MPVSHRICARSGEPLAAQVDCIRTVQVFDQCVLRDTRSQCFPVPEELCGPFPLPSGTTAAVRVAGISCRVLDVVPAPPPHGPDFKVITVLVMVDLEIIILTQYGLERCRFPAAFTLIRRVILFVPDGARTSCEVLAAEGNWCLIVEGSEPLVCCEIELCVQVEASGTVHLLLPVAGFCQPRIM